MDATPPEAGTGKLPSRIPLSSRAAVLLAISIGLCGGYLDLLVMYLVKSFRDEEGYFRTGRDFLWTVPVGHVMLLLFPAVLLAIASRRRRRVPSLDTGAWLLATLAIWGVLFRLPLYGVCSLCLAAGVGKLLRGPIRAFLTQPARRRYTLGALLGMLGLLAALSSGRQWIQEYRAERRLPSAPPGARNAVLIVWDTVRAYNLPTHLYPRPTAPNLERWARQGVRYQVAVAPTSWTYPSHVLCFPDQVDGPPSSIPSGILSSTLQTLLWLNT